jgi:hypothetical protein
MTQLGTDAGLELRITTDDPLEREICEAYWAVDDRRTFLESIASVARRFGITSQQVNSTVVRCCTAVFLKFQCERCGKNTALFKRRYELEAAHFVEYSDDPRQFDYCPECRVEEKREQQERRAQAKMEAMRGAFEGSKYEALTTVEYDFLVQLAASSFPIQAQLHLKISRRDAIKILERLNSLDLINWSKKKETRESLFQPVIMREELKTTLQGEKSRRQVRRILSPKALELFRKLKLNHPFVYPEVPLCVFIDQSDVEHLFEPGDLNHFLASRVNFLICERDGLPICAVEYQAGTSEGGERRGILFKRRMLDAVGLPLTTVTDQGLKMEDALP